MEIEITIAAPPTSFQAVCASVIKVSAEGGRVSAFLLVIMKANANSFQDNIRTNMAVAARPGELNGLVFVPCVQR